MAVGWFTQEPFDQNRADSVFKLLWGQSYFHRQNFFLFSRNIFFFSKSTEFKINLENENLKKKN